MTRQTWSMHAARFVVLLCAIAPSAVSMRAKASNSTRPPRKHNGQGQETALRGSKAAPHRLALVQSSVKQSMASYLPSEAPPGFLSTPRATSWLDEFALRQAQLTQSHLMRALPAGSVTSRAPERSAFRPSSPLLSASSSNATTGAVSVPADLASAPETAMRSWRRLRLQARSLRFPLSLEALFVQPRPRQDLSAASSAERTCEASFTLIFLIATACFARRARDFTHAHLPETGASCDEWPLPPTRDITFHGLACASVLSMAIAHAFVAADVQSPGLVPWRYHGRLAASAFLAVSLGFLNGKHMSDICPALALAVGGWAQLGAATAFSVLDANVEPALHWGLAFSGVFMGAVAFHLLYTFAEQSLLDVEALSRRDMIDLALTCNVGYLLLWLLEAHGSNDVTSNMYGLNALLTGCIDFVYAWGIHHMLTKRDNLLDALCCMSAKSEWGKQEAARLQASRRTVLHKCKSEWGKQEAARL